MHVSGVCHRDLKLENILLDEKFNLKITGFSFAKSTGQTMKTYSDKEKGVFKIITPNYIAPEINANKEYNTKVDIFSLGVILFTLKLGIFPFRKAEEIDDNYKHICNKDYKAFWKMHGAGDS